LYAAAARPQRLRTRKLLRRTGDGAATLRALPFAPARREKTGTEPASLAGTHRCATLIGAGGVADARLALRVAENLVDALPDGGWLVEFEFVLKARRVDDPTSGQRIVGRVEGSYPA
jgi:hypothetical protein